MINKFRRGLTAEEATLIATDLTRHGTIRRAKEYLRSDAIAELFETAEAEIKGASINRTHANITLDDVKEHDKELKNLDDAEQIYEALLDEVSISCEWHDYLSGEVELYIQDCIVQPHNETLLEVFQITRMAPDDEYSYCPIPTQTTIKKVSLAKWFYNHVPEKANLFDPTESYKTIETGHSIGTDTNQKNTIEVRTPESSLIDSLGLMSWLLSKKTKTFERGEKPNAKQIKEAIERAINDLGINNDEDNKIIVSNLNKDISTALKQLERRLKL